MVTKDIKEASEIILAKKKLNVFKNHFSRIYPFTTENLSGYVPKFDYHNKTVLTTGSSGDQLLNLICCGARNITHLDINPFVKYYFNLKKAAILALNKKSFIEYFTTQEKRTFSFYEKTFSMQTYKKLTPYLDEETAVFWEKLFSAFTSTIVRRKLFMSDELASGIYALKSNVYLQDNNYEKMRLIINDTKVTFDTRNIIDILNEDKEYDYMLLSNILEYIFNMRILDEEEINRYSYAYKSLLKRLDKLLKSGGTMFFHYFWNYNDNLFYAIIDSWLKDFDNIQNICFEGIKDTFDSVMVYHKK